MNQIFRRKKNQEKNPKKIYKIKISYQKKMQITMKNTWLHGFGLCWIRKHLSKYLLKMDNAERGREIKKWYCMNIVIVFIEYSFIPSTNKTQRAILNKSNKMSRDQHFKSHSSEPAHRETSYIFVIRIVSISCVIIYDTQNVLKTINFLLWCKKKIHSPNAQRDLK